MTPTGKTAAGRLSDPYPASVQQAMNALGRAVDRRLADQEIMLCSGGEPTFTAVANGQHPQWQTEALGAEKEMLAGQLVEALGREVHPRGLAIRAVGKTYPGEALPRWAWTWLWDETGLDCDSAGTSSPRRVNWPLAAAFLERLCTELDLPEDRVLTGVSGRRRQALILPLLRTGPKSRSRWVTCPWTHTSRTLPLHPGEGPAGLRLPLHLLSEPEAGLLPEWPHGNRKDVDAGPVAAPDRIQVALVVEPSPRGLQVFLPPTGTAATFLQLIGCLCRIGAELSVPLRLEGFLPAAGDGLQFFQVTPDPGVLEVNLPPATEWQELAALIRGMYRQADRLDLAPWREQPSGRRVCTGGGCHLTLGGPTPEDSPFVRRPDLLASLVRYVNRHPSLSYLFSGRFVGRDSQAPRVDESDPHRFAMLNQALDWLDRQSAPDPAEVEQVFRHLLTDLTGNQHRAEICLDKFWQPERVRQHLGLIELRAFAMPPGADQLLALLLLVRCLVAWFLEEPRRQPLQCWGEELHDRFMLPACLVADLNGVVADLNQAGFDFSAEWLQPLVDFHFPEYAVCSDGPLRVRLRRAHEPWPVVGGESDNRGVSRLVDTAFERIEITVQSDGEMSPILTCNGRVVPLHSFAGGWLAGIRYKCRQVRESLCPQLPVEDRLLFRWFDRTTRRACGAAALALPKYNLVDPGPADFGGLLQTLSKDAMQREQKLHPLRWTFDLSSHRSAYTL